MRKTTTETQATALPLVVLLTPGHRYEGQEGWLLPAETRRPLPAETRHPLPAGWQRIEMTDGYITLAREGEFAAAPAAPTEKQAAGGAK